MSKEYRRMITDKQNIVCRRLEGIDINDWCSVEGAFWNADFAHFKQTWEPAPTPGFRPAKAAALWSDDALYVFGDLCDDDIHNSVPETDLNKLAIQYGDVFEVFLKPADQASYAELHVSPTNQNFQLRLPDKDPFQTFRDKYPSEQAMLADWLIAHPVLDSRVRINAAAKRWQVVMRIPHRIVLERGNPVKGDRWLYSFCRYDYTRPYPDPVFSSTSPHLRPSYHLLDDYGTLEFA
jgi:hypothetical protein